MKENNKSIVLDIEKITKHLGSRKILDDISLQVMSGEVFGFLGPNGSGKTTTIKLMLGLLNMESGSIKICGHDVVSEFEPAMSNIGGIIENPEMYKYLTGRENLEQYGRMYGDVSKERYDEIIKLVKLESRINDKIAKYSLGMRQRLGLAQALLCNPKLLVLDEPTNGLDPAGIKDLRDILTNLAHTQDVSVFISSHQLAELDLMCDRVGIIDKGKLLGTYTIDEIRNAGSDSNKGVEVKIEIDPTTAEKIPSDILEYFNVNDSLLDGKAEYDYIPQLVSELCAAGVRIFSVNTVKHSIEDVFLALTTSEDDVGIGGFTQQKEETPDTLFVENTKEGE